MANLFVGKADFISVKAKDIQPSMILRKLNNENASQLYVVENTKRYIHGGTYIYEICVSFFEERENGFGAIKSSSVFHFREYESIDMLLFIQSGLGR